MAVGDEALEEFTKQRGHRDGDGDGFVLDGKPGMRPFIPGVDMLGRGSKLKGKRPSKKRRTRAEPMSRAVTEVVGDEIKVPERQPGEPEFAWQSRALAAMPPETKHAIIAKVRERTDVADFIADAETKWRSDHGLPEPKVDWDTITADLGKAQRIVEAVRATPRDEKNDRYRAAYTDFKGQTEGMWRMLTEDLGVTVEVWDERVAMPGMSGPRDDPYETAEEQARDLIDNRHMFVNRGGFFIGNNPTTTTGTDHPWMTDDDYFKFRAVHDAFGHAGVGGGFDRHGEYEAWVAHNSMYQGEGRKAMSTEYHAVNSYLWATGEPLPVEHWGILLPDDLIQNVFDKDGNVIRKTSDDAIDRVIEKLKLTPSVVSRIDNAYEKTNHHHVLGLLRGKTVSKRFGGVPTSFPKAIPSVGVKKPLTPKEIAQRKEAAKASAAKRKREAYATLVAESKAKRKKSGHTRAAAKKALEHAAGEAIGFGWAAAAAPLPYHKTGYNPIVGKSAPAGARLAQLKRLRR